MALFSRCLKLLNSLDIHGLQKIHEADPDLTFNFNGRSH